MKYKLLTIVLPLAIIIGAGVYFSLSTYAPAPAAWVAASELPKRQPDWNDHKWFWVNDGTIYCKDDPMREADAATFEASSDSPYAKDKDNVYYCAQVVSGFDPATFSVVGGNYGKDATHVVYGGYYLVSGADPRTFSLVPSPQPSAISSYAKDKRAVYDTWREIPGADPTTFEILPPNAARDKNAIYVGGARFGPVSLITDNAEYAKALPAACNPASSDSISPQLYPGAFSWDGTVIGYMNSSRICVIDKKEGTVQSFPYGSADSASLSSDGSKVLFFKTQKGCKDIAGGTSCGEYSIDRATGKIEMLP